MGFMENWKQESTYSTPAIHIRKHRDFTAWLDCRRISNVSEVNEKSLLENPAGSFVIHLILQVRRRRRPA